MIRAQPVSHFGEPFKPHIPKAKTVEICPFSFESPDKERQLWKEKKRTAERGGAQVQGTSLASF